MHKKHALFGYYMIQDIYTAGCIGCPGLKQRQQVQPQSACLLPPGHPPLIVCPQSVMVWYHPLLHEPPSTWARSIYSRQNRVSLLASCHPAALNLMLLLIVPLHLGMLDLPLSAISPISLPTTNHFPPSCPSICHAPRRHILLSPLLIAVLCLPSLVMGHCCHCRVMTPAWPSHLPFLVCFCSVLPHRIYISLGKRKNTMKIYQAITPLPSSAPIIAPHYHPLSCCLPAGVVFLTVVWRSLMSLSSTC